MPTRWSLLSALISPSIFDARASATPPPGTMPSSTAARVVQRVVHPVLALLHLDLGGAADPDHRHPASQLRLALL
jgi:hypothetical protein